MTPPSSIAPRPVDGLSPSLLRAYSIRARRSCTTTRRANRSPNVGHQRVRRQSQRHRGGVKITAWLRTTPCRIVRAAASGCCTGHPKAVLSRWSLTTFGRVERTPPVCRSALCSLLLPPFGLGSVTVFDHALSRASPSQKPACGFPARASSYGLSPIGIELYQAPRLWEGIPLVIPAETLPGKAASLAPAVQPFKE